MKLTPRNAAAILGGIAALVSFSRVCVLFLEALSTVRDERAQDSELLEVCKSGVARGSLKMRTACLSAQADRASPIVLKAILRAVSTAFEDFSQSVSSPGKMVVVVLFVLSSLFLPVASWTRAFLAQHDDEASSHVVVVANDQPKLNFRSRVSRGLGALRMRRGRAASHPRLLLDPEQDGGDCMIDVDLSEGHSKWE